MRIIFGRLSIAASLALLGCGALLWVLAENRLVEDRVPGLGNYPENVKALPAGEGPFRFAVLGDPEENPAVFRELVKKAHQMGAAFAIIPGDVVDVSTREAFEFFSYQYRALGPAAMPVFAAIGNHDMSPRRHFEDYMGAKEFSFFWRGCLFIFADNNFPQDFEACGRFVRSEIERHRGLVKRTFVVVHKPITDYRRRGGNLQEYAKDAGYLYRILDEEKVDAVLAAHFHGYLRGAYRDTLLLVTGGAGSALHDDGGHHMVLVDVGPDGIRDLQVPAEGPPAFLDRLSYRLCVQVYPAIFGRPWRPIALAFVAAFLFSVGMVLLGRGLRVRTWEAEYGGTAPSVIG